MTFSFVSGGVKRLLGYEPSEWLEDGAFWVDRVHPDDRQRAVGRAVRIAASGGSFDDGYRFLSSDGRWVWLRDVGHAIAGPDGSPAIIRGTITEVTDRKALERDLREAEDRFRRVVEQLPAIVYLESVPHERDEPGRIIYVSPQVEQILGFTPDEWTKDPNTWARQFHPDDRARVRDGFADVERTGRPFSAEYRMYTRGGEIRWFRDEATLVRDADGEPLYWQGIMYDITSERLSEQRAKTSEDRYTSVVEQIPAIVYTEDVTGDGLQVVYINQRVEELLGITQAEWLADPGVWLASIHPDDMGRVDEENRRTEVTGDPFSMEYRMVTRSGEVVWFQDRAVLIRSAEGEPLFWQGVMMDVTDRKEAESHLAEAEERYRALVEQIPVIVYIDPVHPGPTVYISPQAERILGYAQQDWYGDEALWSKIVHPEDAALIGPDTEAPSPTSSTYRLIAKDGRTVWVHDTARLILDDEGDPIYWQGVLVDITEQRRAEELERELERERLEAERLRAEDEMKSTFLQAVSHDLRTPLAAILGLAVTMERDDVDLSDEESRDMARRIANNARKLDGIVSDFLDLERLQRGAASPRFEPMDVGALVRELVANSDLVGERRLALDVAPATIKADPAMVERIVENLLGNAVKHTPGDSRIWVRLDRADDGVLLVVEDDGPGVAPSERETIFEPFRQGSGAASGSGVGLALISRFAALHGGRAWVEERDGGGASFRVLLAWDPAEPAPPTPGDQTAASEPSSESQA
jgi:PAS domain S-box-containing protein